MTFPRASGVLLHPTSLPGGFGIGDLGPGAVEFIDLLASAGQRLWQVLPLVRDAWRARSIEIMGDLPIFIAHDSADVWAHRELFRLDSDGQPIVLTGVPPDYFSATASYREVPITGGTSSGRPETCGGSSTFVLCWRWSIAPASITFVDSRHRGKSRAARRQPFEANG